MFGVGGAVISTPAIRAPRRDADRGRRLDAAVDPAVVDLGVRCATAARASCAGRIVAWVAATGVFAAVGGALLADLVPGNGHVLMIVTAALVAYSAYRLSRSPIRAPETIGTPGVPDVVAGYEPVVLVDRRPRREQWWRLALIGVAAGALCGLLGIGGGILMVPAFSAWVRLPLKETIATSLACVGDPRDPRHDHPRAARPHRLDVSRSRCASASIPGARLGAHLAIRSSDRTLRLLVGDRARSRSRCSTRVGEILAIA